MNMFLSQEIDRMQSTTIMSEQLRDALDNIFNECVPAIWQRESLVSSTLGFWFTDLLERNQHFHTWCFNPNQSSEGACLVTDSI
uniref:Dynein heavy chain C-terminal domain-containing protein n=1 Tax=Glossina palpalis gambiensis TaxID=67801 RepID=A0A1B0BRU3_9MUSC